MPHSTNTYLILALVVVLAATAGFAASFDIIALVPYIPLREAASSTLSFLSFGLNPLSAALSLIVSSVLVPVTYFFAETPAVFVIALLSSLGYLLGLWRLCLLVMLSLLLIVSFGHFPETMTTLSLLTASTVLALLLGIPLGIAKARSRGISRVIDPILDFMETLPLFVYLVPVVLFFAIGTVPGVVAAFIVSLPPVVRRTALGIEQIPEECLEAGRAFGATPFQLLRTITLPLALPSILAGVREVIMLSLSMVIVASVVGAPGLGQTLYASIVQLEVGQGIASGISIVLLTILLDRLTRAAERLVSKHS
ncbi:MAG: ABC transporter permease subunit [Candidatus Paceibacterota bacterium]